MYAHASDCACDGCKPMGVARTPIDTDIGNYYCVCGHMARQHGGYVNNCRYCTCREFRGWSRSTVDEALMRQLATQVAPPPKPTPTAAFRRAVERIVRDRWEVCPECTLSPDRIELEYVDANTVFCDFIHETKRGRVVHPAKLYPVSDILRDASLLEPMYGAQMETKSQALAREKAEAIRDGSYVKSRDQWLADLRNAGQQQGWTVPSTSAPEPKPKTPAILPLRPKRQISFEE